MSKPGEMDVKTEACSNDACGVLLVLDTTVSLDLQRGDFPILCCMECGHHTEVGTGRKLGAEYFGSYHIAWPAMSPHARKHMD